jgi:hypothetical protein
MKSVYFLTEFFGFETNILLKVANSLPVKAALKSGTRRRAASSKTKGKMHSKNASITNDQVIVSRHSSHQIYY